MTTYELINTVSLSLNYRWTVHSYHIRKTVSLYACTWHLYSPQSLYSYTWHLYCPQSLYTYTWHLYCPVTVYIHLYCRHCILIPVLPTVTVYWYVYCRQSLYTYSCTAQSLYHTYTWPAEWPSCAGQCLPPHSCTAQSHCSGQAWCCEVILMVVRLESPLCGEAHRRPSGSESSFGDCPPATRSELGQQAPCSRPLQGGCPRWQGRILWLLWGLYGRRY